MRNTHVLSPLCLQNDKHTDIKIQHCLWMTLFPANFVHSISFIDKMLFLNFVIAVKFAITQIKYLRKLFTEMCKIWGCLCVKCCAVSNKNTK